MEHCCGADCGGSGLLVGETMGEGLGVSVERFVGNSDHPQKVPDEVVKVFSALFEQSTDSDFFH